MNKLKITLAVVGLLAFGMILDGRKEASARSKQYPGADAHYYTTVWGSSLCFSSVPIVVYSIELSSGNGTDYATLYDTVPAAGSTHQGLLTARAAPAVVFSSLTFQGAVNYPLTNNKLVFPEGRRMSIGAFLFKSAGHSGEANIATVEWGLE